MSDNLSNWEIIGDNLQPVIIHIWNSGVMENNHISIQTPKYYMSLRSISDIRVTEIYDRNSQPFCFASLNIEFDHTITGSSTYDNLTLHLKTNLMDKMWEKLLENSEIGLSRDGEIRGRILRDVRYVNKEMRTAFTRDIESQRKSYRPDSTLYFTNTTMAFGLLGEGGMLDQNMYFLDHPNYAKYFKNELIWPNFPFGISCYYGVIENNFYTRSYNPSIKEIIWILQEALTRRELINIDNNIKNGSYGLDSISRSHEKEIIKMLKSDETIDIKRDYKNVKIRRNNRYKKR